MSTFSKIFDDVSWTWIHNDITWCGNSNECDDVKCFRHTANRIPEPGPNVYSYALFKGTEDCPFYFDENLKKG